ncbi:MAG: DUF1295 domain-containing protein [Bacteroidales bacterium]|nr:DUF1295 domain-containing protein [Bacteroidales bacterium]MCF8404505.1 DUF1295 domain-containing protein [Bacteroidales bacterium]
MSEFLLTSALLIWIYATAWFILSLIFKRNDIADIAWGLGYVLLCVFYFFTQEFSDRIMVLYILVGLWGTRLTLHIFMRNRLKTEDFRYHKWRHDWGKYFHIRSYLQVYILQGFLLWLIISPLAIVSFHPQPSLNLLDIAGILLWLIGFYFEAIGDYQLARFKSNPENKGRVMKSGLWKYTRHPNYFGEVILWWGIFLVAYSSPNGLFGLLSPILVSILILFVSGLPMMEKRYNGIPEYEAYKQKTSIFIPRPPKRNERSD